MSLARSSMRPPRAALRSQCLEQRVWWPARCVSLFDERASGVEDHRYKAGVSCWPTNPITFDAKANEPYPIGVWAECDNDSGIGAAQAECQLLGGVNYDPAVALLKFSLGFGFL